MTIRRWLRHSLHAGLVTAGTVILPACGLSEHFFDCDYDATCEPDPGGGTAGASGAGGTGGAGGSGGASGTGGTGGAGGAATTGDGPTCVLEDPVDGQVIAEENAPCAIWVSSSLGDDANPGTRDLPVKTLMKAIALAGADGGPGRVYACAEIYPEAVKLAEVSLYGGFRCDKPQWPYAIDEEVRAEIQAPPEPAPLVLLKSQAVSRVLDFNVIAGDAALPGGSSIAVLALEDSRALFLRSHVIAGNGADGLDGEDGSHDDQPAPQGLNGGDGTPACLLDVGLGASSAIKACPDGSQSIGGQGGDANAIAASDGSQGFEAPDPNPQGYGASGKGEDVAQGTACTPGIGGAHGTDGLDGAGGAGFGKLTSAGLITTGAAGADGKPGLPGQGGGGGGASLGAACVAVGGPAKGGAGGGAGGSGGCGGKPGKGGQAGGSSFAFAILSNGIRVDEAVVQAGNGGNGGHGGIRQTGGKGGLPGYGGSGFGGAAGAQQGCGGGIGGYGGDGGAGGGGRGGHASIVGAPLGIDLDTGTITPIPGTPGLGGIAGNPGGGDGDKGDSGSTTTLDP